MSNRQVIGLLGAALLVLGVFLPIVKIPIAGEMNYFQNGKGDGVFVLCLAACSIVLVLTRQLRWLWATSICSAGIVAFTYFNFQSKFAQMKLEMESELAGNPFRGLADIAVQSVQLEWGWAVLVLGILLLMLAAGLGDTNSPAVERAAQDDSLIACPFCAEMIKRQAKICRFCGKELAPSDLALPKAELDRLLAAISNGMSLAAEEINLLANAASSDARIPGASSRLNGTTLLHQAARANLADACRKLVAAGAQSDAGDGSGRKAYQLATDQETVEILRQSVGS